MAGRLVSRGTMQSQVPIIAPDSQAKSTTRGIPWDRSGNANSSARVRPISAPRMTQTAADSTKLTLALFSFLNVRHLLESDVLLNGQ
jgi:hypothetical protein